MTGVYDRLIQIVEEDRVKVDEPMRLHTTFRVGGPADYFVAVRSKQELQNLLAVCKETQTDWSLIGNGSNLLVGDKGIRGVVIQIGKEMSGITVSGEKLLVQAGALLSKIGSVAMKHSLTGFEFAAGIPGTIGGAVCMNAGAYGGEIKDVLETVTVLTPEGEVLVLKKEELELGYRTSIVAKKEYIVLEAVLALSVGEESEIQAYMNELRDKRVSKQPLEFPSAGSTFKRPEGHFAGKLIQDSQLAGYRVGGAQVSEKHCGFLINRGDATAADVMELVRQVREKVQENFGVTLELEVKQLGEF